MNFSITAPGLAVDRILRGQEGPGEGKKNEKEKGEWEENATQSTTPLHYTSQGLRLFGHGVSLIIISKLLALIVVVLIGVGVGVWVRVRACRGCGFVRPVAPFPSLLYTLCTPQI